MSNRKISILNSLLSSLQEIFKNSQTSSSVPDMNELLINNIKYSLKINERLERRSQKVRVNPSYQLVGVQNSQKNDVL